MVERHDRGARLDKPYWGYGISRRLYGILRGALDSLRPSVWHPGRRYPVPMPHPEPIQADTLRKAREIEARWRRVQRKARRREKAAKRNARTHGIRAAQRLGKPARDVILGLWWVNGDTVVVAECHGIVVWGGRDMPPEHAADCLYCKAGDGKNCPMPLPF